MKKLGIIILVIAALLVISYVYQAKKQSDADLFKESKIEQQDNVEEEVAESVVETSEMANTNPVTETSELTAESNSLSTKQEQTMTQAIFKTSMGDIKVKLYEEDSPKTVANFVKLAQEGFYDGTKFHRVIKDFMIQGGDPNSKTDNRATWGTGGPGYTFEDEINQRKIVRGSLAMANAGLNTNGSQFFLVTAAATPWLDGKHTNFGEIVEGMDVVDKIEAAATNAMDQPLEDVVIETIIIQ